MEEGWSSFVIRKKWTQPTFPEFNDLLRDKADAHDFMKMPSLLGQSLTPQSSVPKTVPKHLLQMTRPLERIRKVSRRTTELKVYYS